MPEPEPSRAPFDLERALDEIEQSGCAVAAFARDRGLPPWKLYEGLRRRRRRGSTKAETAEPEFVPVRLTAAKPSTPFELVLGGSRTLRIPAGFDESALQRLVRTLETC